MALRQPNETIIRTNAELTQLWRDMMGPGGFGQRSLWHIFVEPDGHMNPVVMAIDDVPEEPDERLVGNLAWVLREAIVDMPDSTVAVLLSRPGPVHMTSGDRCWALAVRKAYGPELCPWPMHLATRDRIQVFAPDDLIAA